MRIVLRWKSPIHLLKRGARFALLPSCMNFLQGFSGLDVSVCLLLGLGCCAAYPVCLTVLYLFKFGVVFLVFLVFPLSQNSQRGAGKFLTGQRTIL